MTIKYILGFLLVVSMLSCQKEENTSTSYQKGIESSKTFVSNQQMMTQLLTTYFKSITDSVLIATGTNKIDGAKVTFDNNSPQKINIEYPSWGDVDGYGHWRAGIYEASTATYFDDPQGFIEITFADFRFDKDSVTVDQMSIQNLGKSDGLNDDFQIKVTDALLINGDSLGETSFSMDQTFKRLKDPASIYYTDNDKFEIWGEMNGLSVNEYTYVVDIQSDNFLRYDLSCNWLKFGPAVINTEYFKFESLVCFPGADSCQYDFYTESCENQFLVVVDSNPFPYPIEEN